MFHFLFPFPIFIFHILYFVFHLSDSIETGENLLSRHVRPLPGIMGMAQGAQHANFGQKAPSQLYHHPLYVPIPQELAFVADVATDNNRHLCHLLNHHRLSALIPCW